MSTKATVAFTTHDGQVMAAVYVHNGGDVTPEFLGEFFADVIADNGAWVRGYRFFDPSYLAAKFVAWLSGPTMASQGIGVITDPGKWHAHRRFTIRCHEKPSAEPPEVTEDAGPAAPGPLPDLNAVRST